MQAQSDHVPITHPNAKVLLSVEEAALMMSVGRTFMYTLLRSNEIRSVKV